MTALALALDLRYFYPSIGAPTVKVDDSIDLSLKEESWKLAWILTQNPKSI
jgi:hypothetical protein